jgi:hypothetical protein
MSMASYIAMNPAIDMLVAEDNAVFMIHNVWGGTVGDYREMRKTADIFEGLTGIIAKAYTTKTKKSGKEIRQMMDDETWLFGAEMKEAGFVDDIIPSEAEIEKPAAISEARAIFNTVAGRLTGQDIQKAAELIRPLGDPEMATNFTPKAQTPAQNAGNNTTEVQTMTLNQLMAENPAAKIELDAQLKASFEAGKSEGEKSVREAMSAAGKYLGPDTAYPAPIKALAVDVLNGKKSVEALETTVSAFDALRESQKSATAKDETDAAGETPGQQTPALSEDGIIRSAEDYSAEIARARGEV